MTSATAFVVDLGSSCGPGLLGHDGEDRGQLVYLPGIDAIVAREYRKVGGWRCTVIARRHQRFDAGHIDVPDHDLAAATTTLLVDPVTDADGWAMLMQARIRQRWRGGATYLAACALANGIRHPRSLAVDLDRTAVRRLLDVTRLRTAGLRRLLDRLDGAGFLVPTLPGLEGSWGVYTLAVPDVNHPSPDPETTEAPRERRPSTPPGTSSTRSSPRPP